VITDDREDWEKVFREQFGWREWAEMMATISRIL